MRILAFDHCFSQDLDALFGQSPEYDVRTLPVLPLVAMAEETFPREIVDDFWAYQKPEHEPWRALWQRRVNALMSRVYAEFAFEVFLLPADIYYYIRAVIEWVQKRGIPCVVVHKETTITEAELDRLPAAEAVRRNFPFMCDRMTLCSERHLEFWLKTGADPARLVLTGQPRFDVYASAAAGGAPIVAGNANKRPAKPTILYLTYPTHAYTLSGYGFRQDAGSPFEAGDAALATWMELRNQTEEGLADLVRSGAYRLVIKPHPQQLIDEWQHLVASVDERLRDDIVIEPGATDVRHLILGADIVVGFQTTALYEAVAARKQVIYTFWGPEVERTKDYLIPYHEYPDTVLHTANSPAHMKELVRTFIGQPVDEDAWRVRAKICETHLGPLDGQSSQRVRQVIADVVRERQSDRLRASPPLGAANVVLRAADRVELAVWKILLMTASLTQRQRFIWRFDRMITARARSQVRSLESARELFESVGRRFNPVHAVQ